MAKDTRPWNVPRLVPHDWRAPLQQPAALLLLLLLLLQLVPPPWVTAAPVRDEGSGLLDIKQRAVPGSQAGFAVETQDQMDDDEPGDDEAAAETQRAAARVQGQGAESQRPALAGFGPTSAEARAFDPDRVLSYPLQRPQRLYDVAFVTRIPGRPHALRVLASVMASAAATNALRDARRTYIIINNHFDHENPAHKSGLLKNLHVGSTSVHFLPKSWHPQQATGMLYAMQLFLQTNKELRSPGHGLMIVEDDIAFAPGFADRLQEALRQADQLATQNSRTPRPYFMMAYATNQHVTWSPPDGVEGSSLKASVRAAVEQRGIKYTPLQKWSPVVVSVFLNGEGFKVGFG